MYYACQPLLSAWSYSIAVSYTSPAGSSTVDLLSSKGLERPRDKICASLRREVLHLVAEK